MGNTIQSYTGSSSSSTSSEGYNNMDAQTLVKEAVTKNPIVIFSKSYCPYCHSAKSDISKASKDIKEPINPKTFELDRMGKLGNEIQNYLGQITGRHTVPNVFIGGKTVGGGDEVGQLSSSGILKQMLAQASTKLKQLVSEEDDGEEKPDEDLNIDKIVSNNPVVIYSKTYCPYCDQAKNVIDKYNEKIENFEQPKIIELDEMGEKGERIQNLLYVKTQQRTVPNIFINGKHIGGCDDLMSQMDNLQTLLQSAYNSGSVTTEEKEGPDNIKEIIFGAGCFWGVELAFQRVEGVIETEVGYSNGKVERITYDSICTGMTGAAEVVKVKYDENIVSLKQLLNLWHSRHDVTSLNQQGNDVGTQYRSAIFYTEDDQKEIIDGFISELKDKVDGDIVSDIGKVDKYNKAESYHQQYLEQRGQSAKKGASTRIRCYG